MSKSNNIRQLQAAGEKINSAAMMLNQAGFFGLAEHVSILADELYSEARMLAQPLKTATLVPKPAHTGKPPQVMIRKAPGNGIGVWKGGC